MTSNAVISNELSYGTKINNHTSLGYRQVSPQNSTSITTSIVSSTGPTEFLISPSVMNFAQSRLHFTLTLAGLASKVNFVHANLLETISRITVYDSNSNAILADVSNFNSYSSIMNPLGTKFEDFVFKTSDSGEILKTSTTDAGIYPFEDIGRYKHLDVASDEAASNLLGDGTSINAINPLFSQRNFYRGNVVNTASVLDVTIPLSAFKQTILSVDKQLYFPGNIVVQIYWAPNDAYAFASDAGTTPQTNPVSLSTAINITNIRLDLAVEQNLNIINQVVNMVKSEGLTMNIPYPSVVRTNITSQSVHSYSLQLTRAYGNKILAIVNTPLYGGSAINLIGGRQVGNITQYNSFLNNVAIKSPAGFTVAQGQDFFGNKTYLKGSVIQSAPEYRLQNYCLIDSWFGEKSFTDLDASQVDGLDVGSTNSTYNLQANMSASSSYNWITIIIGQKQLTVNSMGSSVA
jgi:hypothetical protein